MRYNSGMLNLKSDGSGMAKKLGRPKSKAPLRDNIISVYLSDEEEADVRKRALKEGISFAAFIRRAIFRDTENTSTSTTTKRGK